MEKENNISSTAFIKNLDKQTFTTSINLQVDSKANIKSILNCSCYFFDAKINSANGKAIVTGKVGVKLLYLDTDNLTNTILDTQPFSENIVDPSITSDCQIVLTNLNTTCSATHTDTSCKVDCVINFSPVLYLNLAFNEVNIDSNYITKQTQLSTAQIKDSVNTSFEYSTNLETRDTISKILFMDTSLTQSNITAQNGYFTAEGKLFTTIVYETNEQDETKIKQITDEISFKNDIELENLTDTDILNLVLTLDNSKQTISTELEDDLSVVSVTNVIDIRGVILTTTELTLVEDLYSTSNEITINKTQREFLCDSKTTNISETIFGELNLSKDEPAIEEIISNCNISYEITNTYIKNNNLQFEGVINSNLIYVDETNQIISKEIEIPFVVNTKIEADTLPNHSINICITTKSIKARRGTIVEVEYLLDSGVTIFNSCNMEVVDNISVGKELDFSKYDYQIFIAKPNETMWDVCKRIKCHPSALNECNKNLPNTFIGNEKIIVKRWWPLLKCWFSSALYISKKLWRT